MSKKDVSKVQGAEAQVEGSAPVTAEDEAKKLEEFKASKREAALRFKEKKAKEKAERIEKAKKLIEDLKAANLYDGIPEDGKAFLEGLANPVTTRAASSTGSTNDIFSKMFDGKIEVGATVTLMDAFNRTLKGKSDLDSRIKKWAQHGTIVSYKEDKDNVLNSTYTIDALGNN